MKSVIFDLDNTLYSYDRAHEKAYACLQRFVERELGLAPAEFDRLHAEAHRILKRRCGNNAAVHNRLIRYQIILELIGKPIFIAPEMANLYWHTFLGAMELEPDAVQTLQTLRTMGLRIGIGTNMTADCQFEKLRLLGLTPYVDFLVTSEEAAVEKPDARLFALCAEKSGAAPDECCFVGDSLEKDALAAKNAGMTGIWYCPGGSDRSAEGIRVIRGFSELTALLQTLCG